jgi:hypothetical protein
MHVYVSQAVRSNPMFSENKFAWMSNLPERDKNVETFAAVKRYDLKVHECKSSVGSETVTSVQEDRNSSAMWSREVPNMVGRDSKNYAADGHKACFLALKRTSCEKTCELTESIPRLAFTHALLRLPHQVLYLWSFCSVAHNLFSNNTWMYSLRTAFKRTKINAKFVSASNYHFLGHLTMFFLIAEDICVGWNGKASNWRSERRRPRLIPRRYCGMRLEWLSKTKTSVTTAGTSAKIGAE